jgi:hypothetical protein
MILFRDETGFVKAGLGKVCSFTSRHAAAA